MHIPEKYSPAERKNACKHACGLLKASGKDYDEAPDSPRPGQVDDDDNDDNEEEDDEGIDTDDGDDDSD